MPKDTTASHNRAAAGATGWALALALLVAGLAAVVTALATVRVGNIDSEVGGLGEAAATGPLLVIGVGATLFVAVRTGRRGGTIGVAGLSLLLGVILMGGLLLVGLDVPQVLNAAGTMAPEPGHAVEVVLVKTVVLLGIEIGALVVLGLLGTRWWLKLKR